jgi:hypothetical protein
MGYPHDRFIQRIVSTALAHKMNAKLRLLNLTELSNIYKYDHPVLSIDTRAVLLKSNRFYTATHSDENYVLLLTPPRLYTIYEKLVFPFDKLTWIFLIVIFSASFLTIFLINQMPIAVQNYVYGAEVQSPALNVLRIFFGVTEMRLPTYNFGRILLLTFIFFNLIIRTAYQGVMYEMMTKEMSRPEPETFQNLIDQDYKILFESVWIPTWYTGILFEILDGKLA